MGKKDVLLLRKFPQKSCTVEHYFTGMHNLTGKFTYDDFFRKTHAPLYLLGIGNRFMLVWTFCSEKRFLVSLDR